MPEPRGGWGVPAGASIQSVTGRPCGGCRPLIVQNDSVEWAPRDHGEPNKRVSGERSGVLGRGVATVAADLRIGAVGLRFDR